MDIQFADGILISVFSILIVFSILVLLAIIISGLKLLPGDKKETAAKAQNAAKAQTKPQVSQAAAQGSTVGTNPAGDEEERMVAMLVASCLAKDEFAGDVRVVSCERVQ